MKLSRAGIVLRVLLVSLGICAAPVLAQEIPWDLFEDLESASVCDVINAENVELVVLHDTGQLVLVTGPDVVLVDTFVDEDGNVFFGPDPAGFIDFDLDGDGLRSLWWLSLTGNVVSVDGFTGEPTPTNLFPFDFFDVPCDACNFWDDPAVCAVLVDPNVSDEPGPPLLTFNFCGLGASFAMAMTMVGLVATGLVRRRLG